MTRTHFLLITAASAFSLAGCKKAAPGTTVVTWPVLTTFDELAAKAEGLAQVGDVSALRQMLADVTRSGSAVTPTTIPANAKNPAGLSQPLADLADLSAKLTAPALSDDDMKTFTLGLHPLVTLLMQEAGMPHIHANEGPHGGFFHPVFANDGKQAATLEIKLHDDAGDLEVWLMKGGRDGAPHDLPLDSILKLDLPDLKRSVDLRVRDREKNAGEDGATNLRSGGTNYFIFPGETGADAKWLMGVDFAAKAKLSIPGELSSEVFVLKPHVHHE